MVDYIKSNMALHQRKNSKRTIESKNSNNEKSSPQDDEMVQSHSKIPWKKIIIRIVLSIIMISTVYWTSHKETMQSFASQKDKLQLTSSEVPCSASYKKDISKFKGCVPSQCGRLVSDIVVSSEEAVHLLRIFKKGLAYGGSSGGASILDLHSGSLSYQKSFINIYEKLKMLESGQKIFTSNDFRVYSNVKNKIQQIVAFNFGIEAKKLHLTHPTFFSEMTAKASQTKHDEYWHVHIDKETYPSFHYTSLLYLSDYEIDFSGGRFVFVDKNKNVTVEPRIGRVSVFTSGAENPHYVEQVKSGKRYALTVSFTCDKQYAIEDPSIKNLQ